MYLITTFGEVGGEALGEEGLEEEEDGGVDGGESGFAIGRPKKSLGVPVGTWVFLGVGGAIGLTIVGLGLAVAEEDEEEEEAVVVALLGSSL